MAIKIIIVDDNQDKIREISKCLINDANVSYDDIALARDMREAKALLLKTQFDLMILDMALPITSDRKPSHLAGLSLLREIKERDTYNIPSYIVGLSAYKDDVISAEEELSKDLWSIIFFDESSVHWREMLCEKVAHLQRVSRERVSTKDFDVDVLWICALEAPELEAVLRLSFNWREAMPSEGSTFHYIGEIDHHGTRYQVRAFSLPLMGPVASAAYTARLIGEFRPKIVVMSGIMAGKKDKVEIGDCILANPTWDWGSGKHISSLANAEDQNSQFAAAPYQEMVDNQVVTAFSRLKKNESLLYEIRRNWQGRSPRQDLRLHEGPVASGSSVIADGQKFLQLERQHRKLLGIEMEAYPLLFACSHAAEPKPKGFVVKSVCDFADESKNDDYQNYAAYTSANVCAQLIELLLK